MNTAADAQPRLLLSVAMIVRNEESVVPATIASVGSLADEIVLLDTGSTDATVAVASQAGAVVRRTTWRDDFSAVRNELLDHVSGRWILWLNAGETLDAASAAELRAFIEREADPSKVYTLMVELPSTNPAASSEQAAQLRLVPNRDDLWFEGRVRETLKPSVEQAGMGVDMAPGRIMRPARCHDEEVKRRRAQRNLRLASLETDNNPRTQVRVMLATGEAAADLGDRGLAREAFSRAVAVAPRASLEMLEAYYGLLTTFDGDGTARDQQLQTGLAALEVFPLDAQLLCAMGSYMQASGRVDLASRAFETAVKYGQVNVETWHLREIAEITAGCYAVTLHTLGQHEAAFTELEAACRVYPESLRLQRHMLDACIYAGRLDEAVETARRLGAGRSDLGVFCDVVRGACKAVQREWTPALGYLQSAYAAGCRDSICFRWLCFTLVSNGRIEGVDSLLDQWEKVDPGAEDIAVYRAGIKQQAEQEARSVTAKTADGHWLRVDPASELPESPIATKSPVGRNAPVE